MIMKYQFQNLFALSESHVEIFNMWEFKKISADNIASIPLHRSYPFASERLFEAEGEFRERRKEG